MKSILIAVFILLIIIIIGFYRYESFLNGYWIGENNFLQKAQLDDFQLFIAPNGDGYLLITDQNGEFISNQAIKIKKSFDVWTLLSPLSFLFSIESDKYTRKIAIECDQNTAIPKKLKMTVSLINNTLTLYDDKKIYAHMVKDNTISNAAIKMWKKN